MKRIVIADLGTGNLRSVSKAAEAVTDAGRVDITGSPEMIGNADYLILPGQGAIGTWMDQLKSNRGLEQAIGERLNHGPVLGICLGLQALLDDSEENGGIQGMGLLQGSVRHFSRHPIHIDSIDRAARYKVPHMGWNNVKQTRSHPLWRGIADNARFYFVHSYYVESANQQQVMGQCEYGNCFTAAAANENLFATQFHPEKSQYAGLRLLRNFVNWNGVF